MKVWQSAATVALPALAVLLAVLSSGGEREASAVPDAVPARQDADAGGGFSPSPTPSIDPANCVTWTATPTVSPSPDPTPPWTPQSVLVICNLSGQTVSDMHFGLSRPVVNPFPMFENAAGCPVPSYSYGSEYPPTYQELNIDWQTPCVDPGDWVKLEFIADCATPTPGCIKPGLSCWHWTLNGQVVIPAPRACTATPTPTPTPTQPASPTIPCPAGPNPSGGCLPCPTYAGYARAAIILSTCPAIVTPTATPTPTPPPPTPGCPAATAPPGGTCPPCPVSLVYAGRALAASTCPPTAPPSPTPFVDVQGDSNCDGTINSTDALAVLRFGAGLPVVLPPSCGGFDGDVDCNLVTNAVDALKILRHNANLSVLQNEPCPDIGTWE